MTIEDAAELLSEVTVLDDPEMEEAHRVAISALRAQQQPNATPAGWISVEDKLPEPEVEVLVISHGWGNRCIYIGKLEQVKSERSWITGIISKESDWLLWGWSYLKEPHVTHWMPLPEPPEEGTV